MLEIFMVSGSFLCWYINQAKNNVLVSKNYFINIFQYVHTNKSFYQWTIQFLLSVIFIHITNRCTCSIINEITTPFSAQWLKMTVINKFMWYFILIINRIDLIWTYVHSIINVSKNTACNPLLSFCFRYCFYRQVQAQHVHFSTCTPIWVHHKTTY